jgi:energy-coupling factor transporter ATP-binding protein EcfA2
MRLREVSVTDLAGYSEIHWQNIQPDNNLLVGRNGAGKSTLIEAIAVGLNFLNGKRSGDVLTGANEDAYIRLRFNDGTEFVDTLGRIRRSQPPAGSRRVENVFYVLEARRPKTRVGQAGRSEITQHPSRRYEYILREVQHLLRGEPSEQKWIGDLLDRLAHMRHTGNPSEWAWLRERLPTAGPNTRRPVSCGQYDVLSLFIDALRTRETSVKSGKPVYLILDNVEAYLHPALQEEVLEHLRDLLPNAQMILTTHSLKLIARAEPVSVFWLSRELADAQGRLEVIPVRDLSPDTGAVFYDLYGDDTSSAVLAMVLGLESTEYLAFLCASALPCMSVERAEPIERDRQLVAITEELQAFAGEWTLVDVGAGAGDLLVAAQRVGIANPRWEYIAVESNPGSTLLERLADARKVGSVASSSRVVGRLEDCPEHCDAVIFANTTHALPLEQFAKWLADSLQRLREGPNSRLVIHEVETLRRGEHGFVMWTADELLRLFGATEGIKAAQVDVPQPVGVPLYTVVVHRMAGANLPLDLATRLQALLEAELKPKLERTLNQRAELTLSRTDATNLSHALLERERAFLSEQCLNLIEALKTRGRWP